MNGYNILAPFYDGVKRIVFQQKLESIEKFYLSDLVNCNAILVIGGGTGKVIELLEILEWKGILTYVDSSSHMISRARKRKHSFMVHYYCLEESQFLSNLKFDAVITSFYLDQFDVNELKNQISRISDRLKPEGYFLVTDFVEGNRLQHRFIIKSMFVFFSIFTSIKSSKLIVFDTIEFFNTFERVKFFRIGIMQSGLYRKTEIK